jgi:ABC-type amino acid transport substrate-binding protein
VCYFNALPWVFRNAKGKLVGFDIEMTQLLARDLGVELDLAGIARSDVVSDLDDGRCDVVVSGTAITPQGAGAVHYSRSLGDLTAAFVVPQEEREAFARWDDLQQRQGLKLGLGPSATTSSTPSSACRPATGPGKSCSTICSRAAARRCSIVAGRWCHDVLGWL